ncbi:uncharacterized protein EV422DRAFT_572129 [Fimicolochytrium jonesii]|uniref:uncharacterized protein n=1 Tax=Fimicolochytrium jonesii TaxID=1396493 RepID=UPI0022FF422D|nr:uncharacterized protein EV422DRAFT_572129 [Fimicolochytrium jonesii]KAI8816067.1 hypothetical protein EV422DRAFT_572129 [Fimicolochytrium jonesii]
MSSVASAGPTATETAHAKELLQKLVALVARAYYEPRHVVILDILVRVNSQRDEDLAKALRVQAKELHKICGKLKLDGLVKVEIRHELVGPVMEGRQQRKIPRSYFYIDYKQFVDVVKWKIYKIGKMIEKEVQMQMANMPYKCPTCHKEYSTLDFAMLNKTHNMMPLCDICGIEIVVGKTAVDSAGVSEKYTKFMNESQPIVDILKQTDRLIIPEWVSDADTTGTSYVPGDELGFSQEQGAAPAKIVVEVEDRGEGEDDEEFEDVGKKETDSQAKALEEYYASLQAKANGGDTITGKRSRDTDDVGDDERDSNSAVTPTNGGPVTVLDSDDEEEFEEI